MNLASYRSCQRAVCSFAAQTSQRLKTGGIRGCPPNAFRHFWRQKWPAGGRHRLKNCTAVSQQLCHSAAHTNKPGGSLSRGPTGAFARDGSAFGLHIPKDCFHAAAQTSQYLKPGIPKGLAPGRLFGDFFGVEKVTRSEAEDPPKKNQQRRRHYAAAFSQGVKPNAV